jgi:hypothetical protein
MGVKQQIINQIIHAFSRVLDTVEELPVRLFKVHVKLFFQPLGKKIIFRTGSFRSCEAACAKASKF